MSEANSTAPARVRKPRTTRMPAKPHKDFPLFPRANGQWAKKIRGKLHQFGSWRDDPKGERALERWLDEKDALLAGRVPRPRDLSPNGPRLENLIDQFLKTKALMRDAGDLSPYTWNSYADVCDQLLAAFGKDRLLTDILPGDFQELRAKWATTGSLVGTRGKPYGAVRLAAEVNRARVVFNYAVKNGLVSAPIRYGEGFQRPTKKKLRLNRAAQGKKMFEAEELRRMLDAAGQPLRAMILLGINAGLGNSDIARLRMQAIDLDAGWLNYPRPKTGIGRRCPLWPETVQALCEWLGRRPAAKDEADADLVFLTCRGKNWAPNLTSRLLTNVMRELLNRLKIEGRRNFYALRHTLETIGGESRDQVAVDFIMGHEDGTMANEYREGISDQRLQDVAAIVRAWLFPPAEKSRLKIAEEAGDADAGCTCSILRLAQR